MTPCAGLLLVFLVSYVQGQVEYPLDDSSNNACGKTLQIHPDEEIVVSSKGRNPKDKGLCNILMYAVGKSDKKCHGFCMFVTSQYNQVCDAKVQFRGIHYGKENDPYQEMSCFHSFPKQWCFDTKVMSIEVVETHWYAFESKARYYNFSVKVVPICDNSMFGQSIADEMARQRASDDNAKARSRNQGILVGVCLAIVFLIALLITWCYYKNKPFRRDIHNYPAPAVRKGPMFAGFKAKITFNKNSSEDGESKPKKDKKQRQDEASTENEETKPKRRGLKFLNKFRSNKAEEVPLVENKGAKGEDAAESNEKLEEIKEDDKVDRKSDTEKGDDNSDTEKRTEAVDESNKSETEGENIETDNKVADEKEDKLEFEPIGSLETPSVTVTTPGDNENDNKDDSVDS